ncbi:uncharacterized protein LOC119370448 [Jatropha curcas]|uniref:uncharacterized protein LOC119370448 n=1 Tax=Jatropha curcas TaxID=180498 RepID=UPI00189378D9|nr:uncharacterized protein LOC119370448 [Jatropha curcas]
MKNETWILVPRPLNKHVIGTKWVFKLKLNSDGSINKHKARYVVKGYAQQQGVDFTETFAPVARFDTIRLILSLTASEGWQVFQLDVKSAFLNGSLKEKVYIEQLEGFNDGRIEIAQDEQVIFISQKKFAWELLKRFELSKCKPVSTPIAHGIKLQKDDGSHSIDASTYRSMTVIGLVHWTDMKSTTGLFFSLVLLSFAGEQEKQLSVAQINCEAEYVASICCCKPSYMVEKVRKNTYEYIVENANKRLSSWTTTHLSMKELPLHSCKRGTNPQTSIATVLRPQWRGIPDMWGSLVDYIVWTIGNGRTTQFWTDRWLLHGVILKDHATTAIPHKMLENPIAVYVSNDGSWNWLRFASFIPSSIVTCMVAVIPPNKTNKPDSMH